uniref:hairy/enhancer-of-split related with YRPW motif protein 2-like isoform X1 n=1 Tax=Solea senegalensis TaxID=28829 RepID=UPI001CD850FB|nr:hairy/enhancer-of-split related with YRPW motif protein 2-like isoform X1 [Solea senegalensis]
MKRPCEDSSSAESDVDVDGDRNVYPGLMKVRMIRCGSSPTTTTQVMARKKRRGIIEKRRRDRINNSLSELRRLVPTAFEKQGSVKLEKAEILQMTVDHLKMLQLTAGKGNSAWTSKLKGTHLLWRSTGFSTGSAGFFIINIKIIRKKTASVNKYTGVHFVNDWSQLRVIGDKAGEAFGQSLVIVSSAPHFSPGSVDTDGFCFFFVCLCEGYFDTHALALDFLSLGFRECLTEVSRYLSAAEGVDSGGDPLRSRLLSHLASCASQRDAAAALTVASHAPQHHPHHHHHQPPPTFPHPLHPHHWAAALRHMPTATSYGLSGLPVLPNAGGGGAPQRPTELSQPSVTSSYPSHPDSTSSSSPASSSSSLVLPCGPAPLSTSLLSLSATSFPITLHGGFPLFPPSSSSSSSQTHNAKPYRPWGTEVGAF